MTAAGITSGHVAVDGVRFHRYRAGPTRPTRKSVAVLLLHGVPETALTWGPLMAELGRDRVVVAPDLKGLGGSEGRGAYDVPTLVAELAAFALHEIDGPVDVVGHDWGGSLALALAGARPDLVRRLVVIAAPYRKLDLRAAWHIPLFALPVVPELIFRAGGPGLLRWMHRYAWRADTPPEFLSEYIAAYSSSERVTAMLAYYRAAARRRRRRSEGRAKVDVERALVVWGTRDRAMPMAVAESVVRDLGPVATLLALPGVGHYPHEEAPEQVLAAIAEFLRAP